MQIKEVVPVWCTVGFVLFTLVSAADASQDSTCTQIDFDEATLSSLRKCGYMQEFIAKRYDESNHFDPYRSDAIHYLSYRWQGLTCGETVNTYSFNAETELRMAYNLVFDSGALLEVRVFDEERTDLDNKPTLVESWSTTVSTDGWGFFREKLNKTVKQARIQIEANINAGSDLAIEYLTIFNYEVETEECSIIDEFATTTAVPSTTTTVTTTTAAETTTQQPATTSTHKTTTSTALSTGDVETTITTKVSEHQTTVSLEQTTTTITVATTTTTVEATTTTTNGPRDDTSFQPTTSTAGQSSTTLTAQITDSTSSTTALDTTQDTPVYYETISPKQWLWITLAALFAILFVLAASAAIYLCFANQHLKRMITRLLHEIDRYPYKK